MQWITPDWPAPNRVKAISTTMAGGVSLPPYAGLNLGLHVGDKEQHVEQNRGILASKLGLNQPPLWLNQVHGVRVIKAEVPFTMPEDADGSWTQEKGLACAIMTADCLPVLITDNKGSFVCGLHAGWRGLCDGVIESALAQISVDPSTILVWLGPAIGPHAFEVGDEVRTAFLAKDTGAHLAFAPFGQKWKADLYQLARLRLKKLGVQQVFGGGYCTFQQKESFYSYRRDGVTGRMASLIWLGD